MLHVLLDLLLYYYMSLMGKEEGMYIPDKQRLPDYQYMNYYHYYYADSPWGCQTFLKSLEPKKRLLLVYVRGRSHGRHQN